MKKTLSFFLSVALLSQPLITELAQADVEVTNRQPSDRVLMKQTENEWQQAQEQYKADMVTYRTNELKKKAYEAELKLIQNELKELKDPSTQKVSEEIYNLANDDVKNVVGNRNLKALEIYYQKQQVLEKKKEAIETQIKETEKSIDPKKVEEYENALNKAAEQAAFSTKFNEEKKDSRRGQRVTEQTVGGKVNSAIKQELDAEAKRIAEKQAKKETRVPIADQVVETNKGVKTKVDAQIDQLKPSRVILKETKENWEKAKDTYQKEMGEYSKKELEREGMNNRITELDQKFKDLKAPILDEESLNKASPAVQAKVRAEHEKKMNAYQSELLSIQNQKSLTEKEKATLDQDLTNENRAAIQNKLNDAAKTANANLSLMPELKEKRRGEKVLDEVGPKGVDQKTLFLMKQEVREDAKKAFEKEFKTDAPVMKNWKTPSSINEMKDEEGKKETNKETNKESNPSENGSSNKADGTKTEEGSVKTEEGSVKTEEGSVKTEEGSVKTEEGSDKTEEGSDKTNEGVITSTNCDEAHVKIVEKILENKKNSTVFADMVKIAELKMAARLVDQKGFKTIENFVQVNHGGTLSSANETFKNDLKNFYQEYGLQKDLEQVAVMKSENKNPNYLKMRLDNDSASAVLYYLSENETGMSDAMKFTKEDVAAVWAMNQIQSKQGYRKGSANYNLLNFSTRVCQMVGDSSCGSTKKTVAKADVEKQIGDLESKLGALIEESAKDFSKEYPSCFAEVCEPTNTPKLGSANVRLIRAKIAKLVGKETVNSGGKTVKIDPTKTTGKNGNLTITISK
jgi:hypothetical protein